MDLLDQEWGLEGTLKKKIDMAKMHIILSDESSKTHLKGKK
jgi:predicted RNA-binding protein